MFDLGFQELIVIFVIALLVFGPKKLPEVGRSLGRGLAELKKAMRGIQDTMREEESYLRKQVPDLKAPLNDMVQGIRDTEETVKREMTPETDEVSPPPGSSTPDKHEGSAPTEPPDSETKND